MCAGLPEVSGPSGPLATVDLGRVLVTGAASGLGRHLCERFGARPFLRGDRAEALEGEAFDLIVHCAANASLAVGDGQAFRFVDDNILLTERLTRIPHGLFVFLSSVDLYPVIGGPWREEAPLSLDATRNAYGAAKMMAEAVVRERCRRHLILRPTTLLGRYARANNIIRLLTADEPRLTLTAASRFNCLLHDDVAAFIVACLHQERSGIFNLGRNDTVSLEEVAAAFGRTPRFGTIDYTVPWTCMDKAAEILPGLRGNSLSAIRTFFRTVQDRAV